jgi:acyl carrier protein
MENLQKYNTVFIETFGIDETRLNASLAYESVPAWDSTGHMGLISSIEYTFNLLMDSEDILDFSSYEKGKKILAKYKIIIQ